MADSKNANYMFFKTKLGNKKQLLDCLERFVKKANDATRLQLRPQFKVNFLENRQYRMGGYGFLWVDRSEIFHLLMGKNADGSDRIRYDPVESWQPPSVPLEQALAEMEFSSEMSWADFDEDVVRQRYVCPTVAVDLGPLVVLDTFEHDEEQKKFIEEMGWDADRVGSFDIDPVSIGALEPNLCHNVIVAKNVPDWVTVKQIKDEFAPFNTEKRTIVQKGPRGSVRETYPLVQINNRRNVYVTFSENTSDGRYALLMCKKLKLSHSGHETLLYFTHQRQTPHTSR